MILSMDDFLDTSPPNLEGQANTQKDVNLWRNWIVLTKGQMWWICKVKQCLRSDLQPWLFARVLFTSADSESKALGNNKAGLFQTLLVAVYTKVKTFKNCKFINSAQ